MNKTIVIILSIIVIIVAMIVGVIIYSPKQNEEASNIIAKTETENVTNNVIKNEVKKEDKIEETNATEEKISPNAFVTFKVKYEGCGHTTNKYMEVPENFVNNTEKELQEKYSDWKIEKFSDMEIILSKEESGNCGEHYIVRESEGLVTVYQVLDDGTEREYEKTDISTEYLTETDKINMEKGIEVNGIQNLNQLIEDFE